MKENFKIQKIPDVGSEVSFTSCDLVLPSAEAELKRVGSLRFRWGSFVTILDNDIPEMGTLRVPGSIAPTT